MEDSWENEILFAKTDKKFQVGVNVAAIRHQNGERSTKYASRVSIFLNTFRYLVMISVNHLFLTINR